jgi:hypothetical protein
MPNISEIPNANVLFAQMESLNAAVAALNGGSTVTTLTVSAPAPPVDDPTKFTLPVVVTLNPPINNPATIASLIQALNTQAQDICDQLVAAGYIDDMDEVKYAPPPPPAAYVPPMPITPPPPAPFVPQPTVTPYVATPPRDFPPVEAAPPPNVPPSSEHTETKTDAA